jgi:hypothetical protein
MLEKRIVLFYFFFFFEKLKKVLKVLSVQRVIDNIVKKTFKQKKINI